MGIWEREGLGFSRTWGFVGMSGPRRFSRRCQGGQGGGNVQAEEAAWLQQSTAQTGSSAALIGEAETFSCWPV